jgi:predicted DNA-binding protein (MmcQ/YjbR family)
MTQQKIIDYCLQKSGAYLDYPFGPETTVVKMKSTSLDKGRIFAQAFMFHGEPKVTLNCRPDSAEFYRSVYPGSVTRGYHCPPIQQPHFNTINLDGVVPDDELLLMIDHAYDVVLMKFPKYIQREIREGS